MTTDRSATIRLRSLVLTAACALAGWFAIAAVAMAALEFTPSALVLGPSGRTWTAMAATSARLLDAGPGYLRLRGDSPGFVRRLYANGAWLVLPASTGGCAARLARSYGVEPG